MNWKEQILKLLPYSNPFLFVDEITEVDDNHISGNYYYKEDEYFYAGHFPDNPVTPGVILTETMAQIGLVCLGIYLMRDTAMLERPEFAFTSSNVDFLAPVLPNEKVTVNAEKIYFRLGKLKAKVSMYNEQNICVSKGELSGILINRRHN